MDMIDVKQPMNNVQQAMDMIVANHENYQSIIETLYTNAEELQMSGHLDCLLHTSHTECAKKDGHCTWMEANQGSLCQQT